MRSSTLLFLIISIATAAPNDSNRIFGGAITSIENYPEMVALLANSGSNVFQQRCGGAIINNRAILSAAHCTDNNHPSILRARAGSTNASSGGIVFNVAMFINHPRYHIASGAPMFDITIIHSATEIIFSDVIKPGRIAGPNYFPADNDAIWIAGWGITETGFPSEHLRHGQVRTVSRQTCEKMWSSLINEDMLCLGDLANGGVSLCVGDSGSPTYHNGVIVGVTSFGDPACFPTNPSVSTRVSSYTDWILSNA